MNNSAIDASKTENIAGTFVTNNNVTIQNVNAGDNVGGVLYNTGTATLNGTMTGNTASQGAVAYNKGTVTIKEGTYSHNIAKKNSGVIYSDSAECCRFLQRNYF